MRVTVELDKNVTMMAGGLDIIAEVMRHIIVAGVPTELGVSNLFARAKE